MLLCREEKWRHPELHQLAQSHWARGKKREGCREYPALSRIQQQGGWHVGPVPCPQASVWPGLARTVRVLWVLGKAMFTPAVGVRPKGEGFAVSERRSEQEVLPKCFVMARRASAGRRELGRGPEGAEKEGASVGQLVQWGCRRQVDRQAEDGLSI